MDVARCPRCFIPLPAEGPAVCPACRLPLDGAPAAELRQIDVRLGALRAETDGLLHRRAALLYELRATPEPTAELSGLAVRNLLLILGVGLLAVAALVFTLVSWGRLGLPVKATILSSAAALALFLPWPLVRRRLKATAEAVAVVGLLLVVLELYAAYSYGLLDGVPARWYATAAATFFTVFAAVYARYSPLRLPRAAALLAAQLPLALAAFALHATPTEFAVTLLAISLLDLAQVRRDGVVVVAGLVVGALGLLLAGGGPARADAVRDRQWPVLNDLNVPKAWAFGKGAGVTVAVLDSGVDPGQPDLTGSVIAGPDLTAGANPPGVAPQMLHGTNMASIIAGHGHGPDGADGVLGVAPEAKILSVRVILENAEPGFTVYNTEPRYDRAIADGIRYAVDHGAGVINMSLGKPVPTAAERQAIAYAVQKGAVVVAAAGNEGASKTAKRTGNAPYSFPASFPGVIAVAAVDSAHEHAGFSNKNSAVVVSAPGVDIVGAGPGDSYWIGDGTSPATAFVSGVAALIRARHPALAPALVTQAIITGAAHRPATGYSPALGFGEVDALAALKASDALTTTRLTGLGADPGTSLLPPSPTRVVHHDTHLLLTSTLTALLALATSVATALLALRRPRRARTW
ncbi:hypothetical protein GCM10027589_56370 [Actinocorallia lasiicapitis]